MTRWIERKHRAPRDREIVAVVGDSGEHGHLWHLGGDIWLAWLNGVGFLPSRFGSSDEALAAMKAVYDPA